MLKLVFKGFLVLLSGILLLNSCERNEKNIYLTIENQSGKDITDLFIYANVDGYAFYFPGIKSGETVNRVWYDYRLSTEGAILIQAIRKDTVLCSNGIYYANGCLSENDRCWSVVATDKAISITTRASR